MSAADRWAAPTGPIFADWFDGTRGRAVRVEMRNEGQTIVLTLPDGSVRQVPRDRFRRPPDQAVPGATAFAFARGGPARLVVSDPRGVALIDAADPPAPRSPSLWRRALTVAALGVAVLALLVFAILPGMARVLAGALAVEAEVALGEIQFEQTREFFGGGEPLRVCNGAAGTAALDTMVARVTDGVALPYDLQVVVLDDSAAPMLNAYAVPGGRITFFDSMIRAADRPEEIAAVLAHELGHVVNRDPVAGLLQGASATAIMALLAGDISGGGLIGGAAGTALASSHSRRAELAADAFARDQLQAVGLPPSALGRLLDRLLQEHGDIEGLLSHFVSHPSLTARIAEADAAGDPPPGAPALTPKAWQALRGICG